MRGTQPRGLYCLRALHTRFFCRLRPPSFYNILAIPSPPINDDQSTHNAQLRQAPVPRPLYSAPRAVTTAALR